MVLADRSDRLSGVRTLALQSRRRGADALKPRTSGRGPGRRTAHASRSAEDRAAGVAGRARTNQVPDLFFRELIANLQNGIIAITRDGRLALMNEAAYRALGIPVRAADTGRSFAEVLRTVPEVVRVLRGAFELNHLPNRAEMRLSRTGKAIGYTLSLVRDGRETPLGAALLFRDLTRVEQLEERERLRDRLAALGEMAAAIAHEVKNPLGGIEVMAGLLRRRLADHGDAQAMLSDIIKEAKLANAIVVEVLEFVRPIRLQVEPVHLPRVIVDARSLAERYAAPGAIDVALHLAPQLPPVVGDANQLRQLFTNLLANAFEALGGKGRVEVTLRLEKPGEATGPGDPPHRMLVAEVADNGPGVTSEERERIFNPFFTTKPSGSGLGLAIVRKIVDAHDGRIDVRAGLDGLGACFRVWLPQDPATLPVASG
ncbi:MAG: PAS domain-containing protein [Luteitalea sp.]|nr:PAS domain-containing protein [Luteitalea sp.]